MGNQAGVPVAAKAQGKFKGHTKWVYAVGWSPDGSVLASASRDKTIRLWKTGDSDVIKVHKGWVLSVSWSRQGDLLASSSVDGTAYVLKPNKEKGVTAVAELVGHTAGVWSVAFCPVSPSELPSFDVAATSDGIKDNESKQASKNSEMELLATGSADKTIRLWNQSGVCVALLEGHTGSVNKVAWSPDGQTLLSASSDCTAKLWRYDAQSLHWKCVFTLVPPGGGKGYVVESVAWHPSGKVVCVVGAEQMLRMYRIEIDEAANTVQALHLYGGGSSGKGHSHTIRDVAWSLDGRYLATAGENVRIWDGVSRKPLAILAAHNDTVKALAWSKDDLLATASSDKSVRLWNPELLPKPEVNPDAPSAAEEPPLPDVPTEQKEAPVRARRNTELGLAATGFAAAAAKARQQEAEEESDEEEEPIHEDEPTPAEDPAEAGGGASPDAEDATPAPEVDTLAPPRPPARRRMSITAPPDIPEPEESAAAEPEEEQEEEDDEVEAAALAAEKAREQAAEPQIPADQPEIPEAPPDMDVPPPMPTSPAAPPATPAEPEAPPPMPDDAPDAPPDLPPPLPDE